MEDIRRQVSSMASRGFARLFVHARLNKMPDHRPCSRLKQQETSWSNRVVVIIIVKGNYSASSKRLATQYELLDKGGCHRTSRKNDHRKTRPRESKTN